MLMTKAEGDAIHMKYEEGDADGEGGVDHNIFDTVALPDLPVDHHHHPLAPAPQHAPRHVHADAAAATMTAANMVVNATMPDLAAAHAHEAAVAVEAAVEAGMANGYGAAEGVPGTTLRHDVPGGDGLPVVGYTSLQQNEVVRPLMPMPEAIIPPKWLSRYEELKRFKKEYGNLNVPLNYEQNKQLNAWIRTQKQQYKLLHEGKPNHMSQARIDFLNAIGFEWAGERRDKFWHDRYNELVAFHAKHGSTRIPEKYEESPQLHTWVSLQRRQLKMCKEGKPTKLTEERIRLLEAVGLESNIRNSSTWMDRFMELKRYKDEHGDCNVPQKWKENTSLGRWVDNQKTQHKKLYDGKPTHLTIERIQLLVSIGFNWRRT